MRCEERHRRQRPRPELLAVDRRARRAGAPWPPGAARGAAAAAGRRSRRRRRRRSAAAAAAARRHDRWRRRRRRRRRRRGRCSATTGRAAPGGPPAPTGRATEPTPAPGARGHRAQRRLGDEQRAADADADADRRPHRPATSSACSGSPTSGADAARRPSYELVDVADAVGTVDDVGDADRRRAPTRPQPTTSRIGLDELALAAPARRRPRPARPGRRSGRGRRSTRTAARCRGRADRRGRSRSPGRAATPPTIRPMPMNSCSRPPTARRSSSVVAWRPRGVAGGVSLETAPPPRGAGPLVGGATTGAGRCRRAVPTPRGAAAAGGSPRDRPRAVFFFDGPQVVMPGSTVPRGCRATPPWPLSRDFSAGSTDCTVPSAPSVTSSVPPRRTAPRPCTARPPRAADDRRRRRLATVAPRRRRVRRVGPVGSYQSGGATSGGPRGSAGRGAVSSDTPPATPRGRQATTDELRRAVGGTSSTSSSASG